MIARRLSQIIAVALAALTFWFFVSSPGVVGPDFVGTIYALFALIIGLLFGVLFFLLRLGTAGSEIFWRTSKEPGVQVRHILILIGAALAVHLIVGWYFELNGRLEETADLVSLVCWTAFPAALLAFGVVVWPRRVKVPSAKTLAVASILAISCAIGVSYAKFATGSTLPPDLGLDALSISVARLIVAAAAEEVVFRILLLTALLDLTRSRFQAVFLSGVAFGLVHAPLALMQPVVHADWPVLVESARSYAPMFLLQTLAGLGLGVLWLRTGSITLIVLTHAILNLGPTMLTGA